MAFRIPALETDAETLPDQGVASPPSEPGFRISVVEGPDRGLEFTLHGSEPSPGLVGKSPACALRLADPRVSRRHASLDVRAGKLRLVDMDSTNGTSSTVFA